MERITLLEEALAYVNKYTLGHNGDWRPGLVDLWVYDSLIAMHESDYDDVESMTYIWRKTPDEIMQAILDDNKRFTLEYGAEQLDDEIRDYMTDREFVVHVDDVDDEEYKTNLEQRK